MELQELRVPLKLDNEDFVKGIEGSITKASAFGTLIGNLATKAVTGAFELLGQGIQQVGKVISGAVESTTKWATELDSIQDVMGVTNRDAAALNFTLRKAGVETDTLTSGMTILEKSLVKADGSLDTTGQALANFGINALDANGAVKEQGALLTEISNKYNTFSTQQERVNFLTEIFGRSGANLIDVFDTLAQEGGIDKVKDKVEKLGLAIDPGKYEAFQRNLEEVKLALQGVGITIVDSLMPAFKGFTNWWNTTGVQTFTNIQTWLKTNIPTAINTSKTAFSSMTTSWNTQVAPVVSQLITLYTNLNTILEKMSPSTDTLTGKFTFLGVVQRVAVGTAMVMRIALTALGDALGWLNDRLSDVINHWSQLVQLVQHFSPGAMSAALSNTPAPASGGGFGGGGTTNRASGGAVIAGQSYMVGEYKPEMFTPNESGRIDQWDNKPIIVKLDEGKLAKIFAVELQKFMV